MTKPEKVLPDITFHVLMHTAIAVSCKAGSPLEAAHRTLREAPGTLDPKLLDWRVMQVSDKPFVLGDEADMPQEQADGAGGALVSTDEGAE